MRSLFETVCRAPRYPLLLAAVAYACGILFSIHFWRPPLWWLVAAVLLLAGAMVFAQRASRTKRPTIRYLRGHLAFFLVLLALAAVGALSISGQLSSSVSDEDWTQLSDGREVVISGFVLHDGVLRGAGASRRQSVDVQAETAGYDGNVRVIHGGIRISIYSREPREEADTSEGAIPRVYTYGQRLRFPVKLRPPRNFGNPGALDYVSYLHAQGIYALGSVRADRIELLDGRSGSSWGLRRSQVRRSVIDKVHRLWPGSAAGLLDAMLIGESSFIGRETKSDFQRTGIYHILVVSGMNVGILALVVFWILRKFRCTDLTATIVTILLSAGYAYLADAGAPIVRSVIMLSTYLFARLLYRERALLNALGAAALALLVFDSRSVRDASFQLTVLSVLAIAGIAVPLIERTSQPYRRGLRWLGSVSHDISLEPRIAQFRVELRMVAESLAEVLPYWPTDGRWLSNQQIRTRAARWVVASGLSMAISAYELVTVSAVAQISLALPMAWYFHRATAVGLPANLIAVPLVSVLMPASTAAVALSYASLGLARIPALITGGALWGITRAVDLLGGIRQLDFRVASPTASVAATAAAAFVIAVLTSRKNRLMMGLSLTILMGTAVWLAVVPPVPRLQPGTLEVTAIDVGQAESFLVITPQGKTLLVDAAGPLGPFQSEFDFGEDVIAPYLWSRGITRLDAVAVTHSHSDHDGGMPSVIADFRPRELWVGPSPPTPDMKRVLEMAKEENVTVIRRKGGDQFEFGGVGVRVLSPPPDWQVGDKARNDDSLVMRIANGNTAALLTADAEKRSEHYMISQNPQADLLKVGHNGSKTSTNAEFLAAVRPKYAVISVGARNSFGHPRPEVLERLTAMGVRTYRTDTQGAVSFYLDGQTISARPQSLAFR